MKNEIWRPVVGYEESKEHENGKKNTKMTKSFDF